MIESDKRKDSLAFQILDETSKLFELKKEYRKNKLTPKEISIKRQNDKIKYMS